MSTAKFHGLSPTQQHQVLINLVCAQAATVLDHDDPHAIDPHRPFQDLGFDSLGAVDFRNRLEAATGLTISPTIVFDYPTPHAVAEHLYQHMCPEIADDEFALESLDAVLITLEQALSRMTQAQSDRFRFVERLQALTTGWVMRRSVPMTR